MLHQPLFTPPTPPPHHPRVSSLLSPAPPPASPCIIIAPNFSLSPFPSRLIPHLPCYTSCTTSINPFTCLPRCLTGPRLRQRHLTSHALFSASHSATTFAPLQQRPHDQCTASSGRLNHSSDFPPHPSSLQTLTIFENKPINLSVFKHLSLTIFPARHETRRERPLLRKGWWREGCSLCSPNKHESHI